MFATLSQSCDESLLEMIMGIYPLVLLAHWTFPDKNHPKGAKAKGTLYSQKYEFIYLLLFLVVILP